MTVVCSACHSGVLFVPEPCPSQEWGNWSQPGTVLCDELQGYLSFFEVVCRYPHEVRGEPVGVVSLLPPCGMEHPELGGGGF